MANPQPILPHQSLQRPRMGQEWGIRRTSLDLTKDRLSDVFKVHDGSIVIITMFMEITTAVDVQTNLMSWLFDSDLGGDRVIGADLDITGLALGDFVHAELDGTALVKATSGTGLAYGAHNRSSTDATGKVGEGVPLTEGGIDLLFGSNASTTGVGTLTVVYKALVEGAMLAPGVLEET